MKANIAILSAALIMGFSAALYADTQCYTIVGAGFTKGG
jgi:hypothetical protein